MCGILGIINPADSQQINFQNNRISHRGPDANGIFEHENLAFGHQRLSIQDLSPNGAQPMTSADGRFTMIFNGEIYNHEDIRAEMRINHPFTSHGDTQTILYGFAEFGTDLFAKMNGIFALAIFDKEKNELTIARDQFGIKPLYFYHRNDFLIFSSEIKAISTYPNIDKEIDPTALVNYLNFLWSPGEKTPFKFIKKLLPGHFATCKIDNLSTFQTQKYYELPFDGKYSTKTEAQLIDELDEKLCKAVERQLLSDVSVGFFLSGGLDSSAIVAMARKLHPEKNLNCYTIKTGEGESFEGFSNDLYYARLVAKHLNVNLLEVEAQSDIVRDFDKMIWHLDEPQADAAPLNVYNICQLARKNGDVVLLGGTAGDDLFSGYRRHQALNFEKYFKIIPSFLRNSLQNFSQILPIANPTFRRIKKLLSHIDKNKLERMAAYYEWLPLNINKNLFSKKYQKQIEDYVPSQYFINALKNIPKEKNPLNQLLFWEMKFFLTDHNLNYTDKMSMADGVEVRVPFLDLELVEFSTKIPPELKMKGKTTKYLLKKVMERYLPKEVIYRPKAGFGAPVRQWITKDLDHLIKDYLSEKSIDKRGIFDAKAVWQLIKDNKAGKIDASYPIWGLLAIESWFRQFVDKN